MSPSASVSTSAGNRHARCREAWGTGGYRLTRKSRETGPGSKEDAASARLSSLEELNEDEHAGLDRQAGSDDEPYSALHDTAFMERLAGDGFQDQEIERALQ